MPTATPIPARDLLHVDIISVETIPGQMTVRLRAYNGQAEPVEVRPEDISMAFGYEPQPPGPWITAEGLEPFTLLPGQAVDLTLIWQWAEETYASLKIGVYRFAIEMK
jgi:hypothetical protein